MASNYGRFNRFSPRRQAVVNPLQEAMMSVIAASGATAEVEPGNPLIVLYRQEEGIVAVTRGDTGKRQDEPMSLDEVRTLKSLLKANGSFHERFWNDINGNSEKAYGGNIGGVLNPASTRERDRYTGGTDIVFTSGVVFGLEDNNPHATVAARAGIDLIKAIKAGDEALPQPAAKTVVNPLAALKASVAKK